MDERPSAGRIYASISCGIYFAAFFSFLALIYASTMGLIQNVGIFLASLVVAAILEVLIWVSWTMNQNEWLVIRISRSSFLIIFYIIYDKLVCVYNYHYP